MALRVKDRGGTAGRAARLRRVTVAAAVDGRVEGRRRVPAIVRALRPLQWTKNGILFAALVFDRKLFEADAFGRATAAAIIFCCLSSGVYLVNDVRDAENDRLHPVKRRRPFATRELAPGRSLVTAAGMFLAALSLAWVVRPAFVAVGLG